MTPNDNALPRARDRAGIEGRTYYDRGVPVVVVIGLRRERPAQCLPQWLAWTTPPRRGPRNVLLRYPDGTLVVRPFRGLRREGRAA